MYGVRARRPALALALVAAFAAGPVAGAEFQRRLTLNADELVVVDLIGAVKVERASGTGFEVVVDVRGADADEKWIQVQSTEGRRAKVVVRFPLEDHRKYTYPALGRGRTTFSMDPDRRGNDWLRELLDVARGERIEVSGRSSGRALEVWADITVRVPAGKDAQVHLGCGEIDAASVEGDLELRTRSGAVAASDMRGTLLVDTGSGSVDLRGMAGDLTIDTGSGSVDVQDVKDATLVSLDTGSGSVRALQIAARELKIDTGSGRVDLRDVAVEDLSVDTGSGRIEGSNVATDDLLVDTGSGGVDFELVRMGGGRYDFDTGSGGVRLDLPRDVSARFDVSTGSGSIDADLEGVALSRRERQQARFEVGDGKARVHVSTGSGSIHLTQTAGTASRR